LRCFKRLDLFFIALFENPVTAFGDGLKFRFLGGREYVGHLRD
jgi:hypothetical protein